MKPSPFGKYLLLERIAIGGMAEVFLAKSFGIEGFERILAIKRILPQLAEDKAFIGMFIDEARIAGGLSHANITPIYELGKVGSAHYIAMEHVWGKDLLQIMNRFRRLRARMPAGMVAFIGARMCEALDYAHHKRDAQGNPIGLIHRDVSPQNVLVSYDGAVKLIDFGVAKAKSRTTKTQAGVVKGKFGYMSPEQVRGKKIDHRSDIFALGTCLYEMLTLERLFAEETDFATMEKIRRAKLPKPSSRSPGVPAALDDVVMRALTKDPAKRYESAAEVQEALTRIVMTEEPRLSTATLAEWMHNAFAEEMLAEKSRLDTYAAVKLRDDVLGEPSSGRRLLLESTQNGRPPSLIPPSDSGSGEAQDETMVGPMPIDLPEESWPDEPTQIFFSSELPLDFDTSTGDVPAPVVKAAAMIAATKSEDSKDALGGWLSDGAPAAPAVAPPKPLGPPTTLPPPPPQLPTETTPKLLRGEPTKLAQLRALAEAPIVAWQAVVGALVALTVGVLATLALGGAGDRGGIEVHTYPDIGPRVIIDGVDRGAAPLRADDLRPGTHVIEIYAPGFRPVARPVTVAAESTATFHVELAADPSTVDVSER